MYTTLMPIDKIHSMAALVNDQKFVVMDLLLLFYFVIYVTRKPCTNIIPNYTANHHINLDIH